jgi:Protein of unknown function (DUF2808)
MKDAITSTTTVTDPSPPSFAQSPPINPTLGGSIGVLAKDKLPCRLDFGGQAGGGDRYILRIPGKKIGAAVTSFWITYPDHYNGTFDAGYIEVRVKGKKVALSSTNWDQNGRVLEIVAGQVLAAGQSVDIFLSNVKNPPVGGTFYFNCQYLSPDDSSTEKYVGTWIIEII